MRRLSMLALAVALVAGTAAQAQSPDGKKLPRCASTETQIGHLTERFKESPQSFGISTLTGNLVMVFADPETGAWTILLIRTNGTACFGDVGRGWEILVSDPGA